MKILTELPARLFLIVFLGCCGALAQHDDDGVRGAAGTVRHGKIVSGSVLVAGPGLEMALVTGQPYSAEQVSEHIQTLTNGAHIDQKREVSRMDRDSEGRTRTERLMFEGLAGRAGTREAGLRLIHIYDPVEGYAYTLDTQKHIAHRYTVPTPPESRKAAWTGGMLSSMPAGQLVAGKTGIGKGVLEQRQMRRESLGTEVIDGIQVEGTRTSITTPMGGEGNDRPLSRVCEVWHAKELKITMLSKCTDPRSGSSTLRIQNLERSEPDPALFQVPADYTIVEETGRFTVDFVGR